MKSILSLFKSANILIYNVYFKSYAKLNKRQIWQIFIDLT